MDDSVAYAVLESLARAKSEYVSVDRVAVEVNVEPSEVHDYVECLNRLGIPTDAHPTYGLRIPVAYDLIDRAAVRSELRSRDIDWDVEGHLETSSTNDLAASVSGTGTDGTTFFAEHQTRGRGRLGRSWHSPVGSGLWFSVLRRHDLPIEEGWRVTLGAGLAVARAIRKLTRLTPALKWPNDVHIDGCKVAGILTESRAEGDRLKHSVVGIGVNVHVEAGEFPAELRDIACSIRSAGGRVRREDLLVEILSHLKTSLTLAPTDLRAAWSDLCTHWDKRVRVERDSDIVEGRALELADDGSLMIELDGGGRFAVHAGDVTHLRMDS